MVIAPRVNLVRDLAQRTGGSIFCATLGKKEIGRITVATKQSLKRIEADLVILDECFDKETEILTENGFVLFRDLGKEKVAQYSVTEDSVSFIVPTRKIKKMYSGEMCFLNNAKKISCMVTPRHDMLIKKRNGAYVKVFPQDLTTSANIKVAAETGVSGEELTWYEKFLIATQADGNIHHIGKDCITVAFSFSKKRKIDDLIDLISNCGYESTESEKPREPFGNTKGRYRFFVKCPLTVNKNIYEHFNLSEMSVEKAKAIIEYMVKWDGSILPGSYYYSSTNERCTDFYQAVAVLCGYKTNKTIQVDNRKSTYMDVHRLFISKGVSEISTQRIKLEMIKYDDYVYCVEVPDGNIITRRNGKVIITGNCHSYTEEFLVEVKKNCKFLIGLTATDWRSDGYIWD